MVPRGVVAVHFPREEWEGEMERMGVWGCVFVDLGYLCRQVGGDALLACRARDGLL
jgi:hypothetical protein